MKVKELIKLFNEFDPTGERELILSSDAEGNSFHRVVDISLGKKEFMVIEPADDYLDGEELFDVEEEDEA